MEPENGGLEKVHASKNMAILDIYVRFQKCSHFIGGGFK